MRRVIATGDGIKPKFVDMVVGKEAKRDREGIILPIGIATRPFFYPMHVMQPHKNNEEFPVAEEISRKGVNLPSSSGLKEEEIKFRCGLGTMFSFKSYRVRRRIT